MSNNITDMKARCEDILTSISVRDIAIRYFHKSPSWLYHKLDGIDGNGNPGGFTAEETEQFKQALYDLAERLRKCADSIA